MYPYFSSDLCITYKQGFLNVAMDFTKLFQTLLQGIIEKEPPSQDDIRYLGYTESISILERVIVWILTGDISIQPVRLYRVLGLLTNSTLRGWPGIDQDVLDLNTFEVNVTNWPMNTDRPYFSQIPAIKKHFNKKTANTQQVILASLVLPSKDTDTAVGCAATLKNIFKDFFIPEVREFWIKNLEKYKRVIVKHPDLPSNWVEESCEVLKALEAEYPFSQR